MNLPGGGEPPPDGLLGTAEPSAYAGRMTSGGGVAVNTRGVAVMEAEQQSAVALITDGVPGALLARDPGLWGPGAAGEAAARLGWLSAAQSSRALLGTLAVLAARASEDGLDNVVLAGAGGASLAPEAIGASAGVPLRVLDTTDPHEVARTVRDRLESTLVVVPGKNRPSLETDSNRRIYEHAFASLGLSPAQIARRFVVVTDPGSPLERSAREAGQHVVLADPRAAGGYTALTAFGLVPAALAGADVARVLDEADAAAAALARTPDNPGLALGAALGGYALAGHDKAVLADCGSGLAGFTGWAEQLIAESTGKDGRGILPVVVEGEDAPGFSPGPNVHLIAFGEPASPVDTVIRGPLGGQFLVWEYAAAVASRLLGVSPFGQPAAAQAQGAAELLAAAGDGPLPGGAPVFTDGAVEVHGDVGFVGEAADLAGLLDAMLWSLPESGYLAVMAYLDRTGDADAWRLRPALAARTTHPVTFGWGPRMAYGAGQYHRAGPPTGVFLQVTGEVTEDVGVPGEPYSLGKLQLAQALGDLAALRRRGRPAIRLHLRDRQAGIAQLLAAARTEGVE
ncbi:MAG TPA: glucose-6-phosphate isomerase [Streptosporangiaceae bacterium]|nr:glucose-6-phosphate isomerase [Streptosporangiaceae bacterium]